MFKNIMKLNKIKEIEERRLEEFDKKEKTEIENAKKSAKYKAGDTVYHKLDKRKMIVGEISLGWSSSIGNYHNGTYWCTYQLNNGEYKTGQFYEDELSERNNQIRR